MQNFPVSPGYSRDNIHTHLLRVTCKMNLTPTRQAHHLSKKRTRISNGPHLQVLIELSASVMQDANSRCLSLDFQPISLRNKCFFVANILCFLEVSATNWYQCLTKNSSLGKKKRPVGQKSTNNRYRAFADCFNIMYGENVSSNFREQPFELHTSSPVDIQTINKISHEFLWINEGQDELPVVQHIEIFFDQDILRILAEIKKIPVHTTRRPVVFQVTQSQRKTANQLQVAHHILRRAALLSTKYSITLLDVSLSLYPQHDFNSDATCIKKSVLINHFITTC